MEWMSIKAHTVYSWSSSVHRFEIELFCMVGMERDACAIFGKGGLGPFRDGMMTLCVGPQVYLQGFEASCVDSSYGEG